MPDCASTLVGTLECLLFSVFQANRWQVVGNYRPLPVRPKRQLGKRYASESAASMPLVHLTPNLGVPPTLSHRREVIAVSVMEEVVTVA
jgi:hypothetical protein